MRRNERTTTRGEQHAPERSGGRRFDAFELVQQRGTVSGDAAASDLPRVADALASDEGRVRYAIAGIADAADRPALDIAVNGTLSLTCQRCLQPMSWSVAQRTTILVARDERELALLDDSDEHEVVLADVPLDALELVEDELLLTMPYAPRHPDVAGASCAPSDAHAGDEAERASPFDALAGLQAARDPNKGKQPKR